MPIYKAPTRDTRFVINELLELESYGNLPGFEAATPDTVDAIVEEVGRFCSEVIQPLNVIGDSEGCTRHPDGSVTTPTGFKDAYKQYVESGWGTLAMPAEFGGQGLPHVLGFVLEEYLATANHSFAMYPGLANGAVGAINVVGSAEQKQTYLPKMISGEWLGTMNLTEPHCGTDLGLIKSKAEPKGDGSFAITGTKIFISAGEHDLTDNIIHLVLAKTPGAPEGSKGISLFIVPKLMVEADGSLGARNAVSCGSIEHKMGIHGNSTCVMNYDAATGWLLGEENKGLAAMFIMMNAARLGVGMQGLAQSEVAYQNAVLYAKERRQGRALVASERPDPAAAADPIIVHPDVRRMLMDAKGFNEGMRALILWGALLADLEHAAQTPEERADAEGLLGLLTPVIKGYGTDRGYDMANNMMQVFGGHGYIKETGVEQFVRDSRIAMIYEGTNGIQAMDLCGRKLARDGGKAIQAFFKLVDDEVAAGKADEVLKPIAERLEKAVGEQKAATLWFMQNALANPDNLGAGAHHYMHIMGVVCLTLMWLRMAKVAQAKLATGSSEQGFYEAKLTTARYFAERFTPDAGALRRKIETGSEAMMALTPEQFETA